MVRRIDGGGVPLSSLRLTGPFEESPLVARVLSDLARRSERGGASSIRFLPARTTAYDAFAFAFGTKLPKQLNVTSASKGVVRGTLVVSASGNVAGALVDRVVGYAAKTLHVGNDALAFEALRAACQRAVDDLLRGASSATIAFGAGVTLSASTFARLKNAARGSDDALAGDDALRTHYGATNTYDVHIRLPNGDDVDIEAQRNDPKRIELATRIPLELPVTSGDVLLEACPAGADVDAYVEARRYVIHVGSAQSFDVAHAIDVAKKFQAAHPEVRWGTTHEAADRALHRVAPSPMPYQDS